MVVCAFVHGCVYIRYQPLIYKPLGSKPWLNAPSASRRSLGRVGGIELASPRLIGVLNSVVGNAIEDGPEALGGWVGACVFPRLGASLAPSLLWRADLGGHAGASAPFPPP